MDVALPFQDFDERIEPQIATRRDKVFLAGSGALVVVVPLRFVIARFRKGAANRFFDSHACCRITSFAAATTKIGVLRIFAERELDAGQRAFKRQLRSGLSPAELDG